MSHIEHLPLKARFNEYACLLNDDALWGQWHHFLYLEPYILAEENQKTGDYVLPVNISCPELRPWNLGTARLSKDRGPSVLLAKAGSSVNLGNMRASFERKNWGLQFIVKTGVQKVWCKIRGLQLPMEIGAYHLWKTMWGQYLQKIFKELSPTWFCHFQNHQFGALSEIIPKLKPQ